MINLQTVKFRAENYTAQRQLGRYSRVTIVSLQRRAAIIFPIL